MLFTQFIVSNLLFLLRVICCPWLPFLGHGVASGSTKCKRLYNNCALLWIHCSKSRQPFVWRSYNCGRQCSIIMCNCRDMCNFHNKSNLLQPLCHITATATASINYSAIGSIQILMLGSIVVTATPSIVNAGKLYKAYRIVSRSRIWNQLSESCHGFTCTDMVPSETPNAYGLVASHAEGAHMICTLPTKLACEHMMTMSKTIGSAGCFPKLPATTD